MKLLWDLQHVEIKGLTVMAQNVGRGEIEVYCSLRFFSVRWYITLEVDCDELKMYTLSPKETTLEKKQ